MDHQRKSVPRPDEALLASHMAGDESAMAQLIERHKIDLHRFLQRFLGSATAADDVFQETFLQVHLSAGTFEQSRAFKPWLYTIAANKARDFHRKRRRRTMTSLSTPVGGDQSDGTLIDMLQGSPDTTSAASESIEESLRVKDVVDSLPDHHREIVLLSYFQRMSYSQIAETLQVPLGTVKSRLHAAVATFADRYRRAFPHSFKANSS